MDNLDVAFFVGIQLGVLIGLFIRHLIDTKRGNKHAF